MRPARVTIARKSMGVVALAAVGLAALRHPSPLAASALFSLAVALLFAAAIAGISLPGRRRAIWSSFALCGFGYLLLSFGPWSTMEPGPHLITEPLIGFAYSASTGHEGAIAETDSFDTSVSTITEYWKTSQRPVPVNRVSGLLFARPNARQVYTRDFYAMKLVPWGRAVPGAPTL